MNYSQKTFVEIMKSGKIAGEKSIPKHIETVMSNVFIFENTVYKLYKNDNDFFNKAFRDLAPKRDRMDFTKKDFEWNHTLSPSIYTKVIGIKIKDGEIEITEPTENADEAVIVMNRAKTEDLLFEKLLKDDFSPEESFSLGKQLGETLKKAQKKPAEKNNFYNKFEARINDLRNWVSGVTDYIDKTEFNEYCDFLEKFRKENREWFENKLSDEMVTGGDLHSHNAIFSDGILYLIDTYAPKEEWLVDHQFIPMYRIGADIWALTNNKDLFERFLRGYEEGSGYKVDRRLDDLYIIYASSIMVVYLYILQRTDAGKKEAATRFHKFIREYYIKL
jgi:aminoglycoside phosphotransferase family enzyme